MPNISTKMEYNFDIRIYLLPKLLSLNLEVSNKKDDFLDNSSIYLLEHLYNVLALIPIHVYDIIACFYCQFSAFEILLHGKLL